jgi:hypothetical protein
LDETDIGINSIISYIIDVFSKIFPKFIGNSALVFNKWNSTNQAKQDELKAGIQKRMKDEYGFEKIPCFFVDRFYKIKMMGNNFVNRESLDYGLNENAKLRTLQQAVDLIIYLKNKTSICNVGRIELTEEKTIEQAIDINIAIFKNKFSRIFELSRDIDRILNKTLKLEL